MAAVADGDKSFAITYLLGAFDSLSTQRRSQINEMNDLLHEGDLLCISDRTQTGSGESLEQNKFVWSILRLSRRQDAVLK
jgi:hypothetical protein